MEEISNVKEAKETKELREVKEDKKDKKKSKEQVNKKNPVQLFFENLFSEFRKVIWPSRNDLIKQTVVVIIISLFMGVLIFGMDALFNFLQSLVAGLAS